MCDLYGMAEGRDNYGLWRYISIVASHIGKSMYINQLVPCGKLTCNVSMEHHHF